MQCGPAAWLTGDFADDYKKAVYTGFTIHGWVGMVAAGIAALRLATGLGGVSTFDNLKKAAELNSAASFCTVGRILAISPRPHPCPENSNFCIRSSRDSIGSTGPVSPPHP
jgi:hypothetical protein